MNQLQNFVIVEIVEIDGNFVKILIRFKFKKLIFKLNMKVQDKINYNKKISLLKRLKHELKKKRIVLDEERTNFKLDRLEQLSRIKNTSEIKGYPCVGFSNKISDQFKTRIGVKINPLETRFNKLDHPSNLEHIILKRLTEDLIDTNICPHIVYYLDNKKVSNRAKSLKFISDSLKELERDEIIKSNCNILFSEFVEGGCLNKWIKSCYGETSDDSHTEDEKISPSEWKYITFSLLYTIYVLQEKYKIVHNDIHYGNILIDNTIHSEGYIVYEIQIDDKDYTFYFKNYGFIAKLWDFEYAMCYNSNIQDIYPNKFIIKDNAIKKNMEMWEISEDSNFYDNYKEKKENTSVNSDDILCTPYNYNEYYDVHYFLTSLLDLYISEDLFDWIISLYPKQLIADSSEIYSTESKTITCTETEEKSNNYESSYFSETETETETETDSSSIYETSNKSYSESDFLYRGRIINGVEKMFKLPKAKELLLNSFFSEFLEKPKDFDESNSLFFKFKLK